LEARVFQAERAFGEALAGVLSRPSAPVLWMYWSSGTARALSALRSSDPKASQNRCQVARKSEGPSLSVKNCFGRAKKSSPAGPAERRDRQLRKRFRTESDDGNEPFQVASAKAADRQRSVRAQASA